MANLQLDDAKRARGRYRAHHLRHQRIGPLDASVPTSDGSSRRRLTAVRLVSLLLSRWWCAQTQSRQLIITESIGSNPITYLCLTTGRGRVDVKKGIEFAKLEIFTMRARDTVLLIKGACLPLLAQSFCVRLTGILRGTHTRLRLSDRGGCSFSHAWGAGWCGQARKNQPF